MSPLLLNIEKSGMYELNGVIANSPIMSNTFFVNKNEMDTIGLKNELTIKPETLLVIPANSVDMADFFDSPQINLKYLLSYWTFQSDFKSLFLAKIALYKINPLVKRLPN